MAKMNIKLTDTDGYRTLIELEKVLKNTIKTIEETEITLLINKKSMMGDINAKELSVL